MTKQNQWAKQFGASRRIKDRAILAAAEAQIASEGSSQNAPTTCNDQRCSASRLSDEERERLARAFGRPANTTA